MNVKEEIDSLLSQLLLHDVGEIHFHGSVMNIRLFDIHTKLALNTTVYNGSNYIPKSVRNCLTSKAPLPQTGIRTYLSVDEENFKIHLNYVGKIDHLDRKRFLKLLEEFAWIAEAWRKFLDEHDRQDLVFVHHRL